MSSDGGSDKILDLLRPYAANWSGTLKRGDIVIPAEELPKLVERLAKVVFEPGEVSEVSDLEVFNALQEASRSPSLQTRVTKLRESFRILRRTT